ncbi:putative choline transporter, neither null mutation nor overexpression affects choline transport [Allomyces arbusculus]|nr:putative choline transporter, neither null mutation nor overexpression affects choline transport [Allomyces arbusculus]
MATPMSPAKKAAGTDDQPPSYGSFDDAAPYAAEASTARSPLLPQAPQYGHDGLYPDAPQPRFVSPKGPQDLWAAIAFIAHLGGVIALGGVSLKGLFDRGAGVGTLNKLGDEEDTNVTTLALITAGIAAGLALLVNVAYLFVMRAIPKALIKGTYWLSAIYMAFMGIVVLVSTGSFWASLPFLLMIMLYWFMYMMFRPRMPFASVMLATISDVTIQYPATMWVTVFGSLVQLGYAVWWLCTVAVCVLYFGKVETDPNVPPHGGRSDAPVMPPPEENTALQLVTAYLVFSAYWTVQVCSNVVHVTVAGVFATYYFQSSPDQPAPRSPTWRSLKRAVTTSFGSICLGSLLIAVIQTIRALANSARYDENGNRANDFIYVCLDCLLKWVEDLATYFNVYAFTQVAIYGKPFARAARDTWTLIKDRGVEAVINDSLIGNVLVFGGLLIAAVTFTLGWIVAWAAPGLPEPWIVATVAGLIGIAVFAMVSSVISSGAATTFVCLAEDPQALAATKPELWTKVAETYPHAAFTSMYV